MPLGVNASVTAEGEDPGMPKRTDAFVVWMDRKRIGQPGALPSPDDFCGRVEHVRTSRRAHFASSEELLRFLREPVAPEDEEPKPEQGPKVEKPDSR